MHPGSCLNRRPTPWPLQWQILSSLQRYWLSRQSHFLYAQGFSEYAPWCHIVSSSDFFLGNSSRADQSCLNPPINTYYMRHARFDVLAIRAQQIHLDGVFLACNKFIAALIKAFSNLHLLKSELHLCGPANGTGIPDVIFCYNKCSTDGHLQIHDHNEDVPVPHKGAYCSRLLQIHVSNDICLFYLHASHPSLQMDAPLDHALSYDKASLNGVLLLSSSPFNSNSSFINNKTAPSLTEIFLEDDSFLCNSSACMPLNVHICCDNPLQAVQATTHLMRLDTPLLSMYYADERVDISRAFAARVPSHSNSNS